MTDFCHNAGLVSVAIGAEVTVAVTFGIWFKVLLCSKFFMAIVGVFIIRGWGSVGRWQEPRCLLISTDLAKT